MYHGNLAFKYFYLEFHNNNFVITIFLDVTCKKHKFQYQVIYQNTVYNKLMYQIPKYVTLLGNNPRVLDSIFKNALWQKLSIEEEMP